MNIIYKSFREYLDNFKVVFAIMAPIFIIQLIIGILVQAGVLVADVFETDVALFIAVGLGVIGIVVSCMMGLVYIPAALKVFQRRAEGTDMSISSAIQMHKSWPEIWSFIKLYIASAAVALFYFLISALPSLLVAAAVSSFDLLDLYKIPTIVLLVVTLALTVYLFMIHMPKILYMFNIYVSSKGYTPWQAVKESIRLGKTHRGLVWESIATVILIGLLGIGIETLLLFLLSPREFIVQMNNPDYVLSTPVAAGSMLIIAAVSVFVTSALTYMYLAKKYQYIRDSEEKQVG